MATKAPTTKDKQSAQPAQPTRFASISPEEATQAARNAASSLREHIARLALLDTQAEAARADLDLLNHQRDRTADLASAQSLREERAKLLATLDDVPHIRAAAIEDVRVGSAAFLAALQIYGRAHITVWQQREAAMVEEIKQLGEELKAVHDTAVNYWLAIEAAGTARAQLLDVVDKNLASFARNNILVYESYLDAFEALPPPAPTTK